MTRINCGVHPREIPYEKFILAEHYEMVRIPNALLSGKAVVKNIPDKFSLGAGHVKFFYNKIGYLHKRYCEVHNHLIELGYNVQNYEDSFLRVKEQLPSLYNDYKPTESDRKIIFERFAERLAVINPAGL